MHIAILDGDDHFHLFWHIDDYHIEDGGDGPNLLICNEAGQMFLIPGRALRTSL